MWTARLIFLLLFSVIVFTGSLLSPSAVTPAFAAPPVDAIHEVMAGDDLRLIAGYYYGDTRQWERIWKANRDQIKNPNRIEKGSLLRIPDSIVPAEPYADFVARARRPSAPPPGPPAVVAPPATPAPTREPTGPPAAPKLPAPPAAAGQPTKAGTPPGPPPLPAKRP
jgi:hypothetical protein